MLALFLLVPLVGGVRDFLQELPATSPVLRDSGELSWLGDSGAGGERRRRARSTISVSVPDAISAVLGIAGSFFGVFLAGFTLLFICLFLLTDIERLKRALVERADARRGRALARRVGAGDDLDLALGDRRGRDRRDRRHDAGRRLPGCSARATRSRSA